MDAPRIETFVGVTKDRFLDLVRFERAASGLDPGNRLILAEHHVGSLPSSPGVRETEQQALMHVAESHPLITQFKLSSNEILDLIAGARRLKMAVRGWVAEEHLRGNLAKVPGVTHCERLDEEGGPDLRVAYRDGPLITIECKNVARETDRDGRARIDLQRTRAAKGDPCSRYYMPAEFDVVAACLHAVTSEWGFQFSLPSMLPPHKTCVGRLASNIRVDSQWTSEAEEMFRRAYAEKGVRL